MKLADRKLALAVALVLALAVPLPGSIARAETAPVPAAELTAEQAREARIQKHLLKREEKRVVKEQKQTAREEEKAQQAQTRAEQEAILAQQAAEEEAVKLAAASVVEAEMGADPTSALPKRLAEIQRNIRASRLGQDPTVVRYLDLVDRQEASAQQVAAFGNFIAEAGARKAAVVYYAEAIKLDKTDPLIWLNLGTLHRQLGDPGDAVSAYRRAVELENTNAVAHFNLGATYDSQGKYEDALKEYRVALTLDPKLADPAINPQAANNERLVAVKLMLYQETIGGLGIPLQDLPDGKLDDEQ